LAPLADHASSNALEHVDFTLNGIHLTGPKVIEITERGPALNLLRNPLTDWESLEPKVSAIDFPSFLSSTERWAGSETVRRGAMDRAPRRSYVRLLSLLAYELFGGPWARVESTGRYVPVTGLSEEGNVLLRRGLVDEVASAVELAQQLASGVEPAERRAACEPLLGAAPGGGSKGIDRPPLDPRKAGAKGSTERGGSPPVDISASLPRSSSPPGAKKYRLEEFWEATQKRLSFGRSDRVTFSVFSPHVVCPAEKFILEFWAHLPTQTDQVISLARQIKRDQIAGVKTGVEVERGG
jgi:hypothetical protein